ncbi:MAG: transporter substrate-binding domain-containing protein [Spirochaetales bacterium]|nr:transporter substrate-binding domain-containing protein [Spirochaetales bacterium]
MKKYLIVLFVLLIIFTGCSRKTEETTDVIPLKVGMELAYPPFEMTDTDGNPTGISVDIVKAFGEYLGRPVEIQNIAWDGLIPSLKTGKVDMVLSSMTITEERKGSVDFSDPYSKSFLTMLISKDSPVTDFTTLNVEGRSVAVRKGTSAHLYARENLPNTEIMVFDKESACVLEVVGGKADAFLYDQLSNFRNWEKNQETTRLNLTPFQSEFEYWGAAFKKGNTELQEEMNAFIPEFKKNGGFDELAVKYLKEVKEVFDAQGVPFFF